MAYFRKNKWNLFARIILPIMFTVISTYVCMQVREFSQSAQPVIFSLWWHHQTGEKILNGTSSIWPLWKVSAVVIAATCEKSELCQEWSSDSRAGEVSPPCSLCCSTHLVQTTAAACSHCAKHWRPLAEDPNSNPDTIPHPKLKTYPALSLKCWL